MLRLAVLFGLALGVAAEPPSQVALPAFADFAATPAVSGFERAFLDELAVLLPPGVSAERDPVFGSLIVRPADAGPVRRLVMVGVDEQAYVVSGIRDDGWLRVRSIGARNPGGDHHLLHEGRPVSVHARDGDVPGVFVVDSIHLRGARPESLGESDLWLDVGADDAAEVAALGIAMLDPVTAREIVAYEGGRVAGPAIGRRAAAFAMLGVLHDGIAEDVAFAFVGQWVPGSRPLGRGGAALVQRSQTGSVLVLSGSDELTAATGDLADTVSDEMTLRWVGLRVAHAGSPVETVTSSDMAALAEHLHGEFGR